MTDLPFAPSWQNRFFDLLSRLPVHKYLAMVLITLAVTLANHLAPWAEGKLPWGAIDPVQFNFLIWVLVALVAGDYFLGAAGSALDRFRAALSVNDETFGRWRYEFTHLSSRTGWVITGLGALFSVWGFSFSAPYQRTGASGVVMYLLAVLMFGMVFFFFYFLWRMLRMTVHFYDRVERINIFHLQPLYAFSGLTSAVGIFFVFAGVLSYLTNVVLNPTPQVTGFVFFTLINLTLAVMAFILPLGGIHRKLEAAKRREAAENDRRLEEAYRELHRRADRLELAGMSDFHHEIEALVEFRREIKALSTWPWGPGTLRNFITALLLPIVLWVIQQLLQRFFV